ncbi:hypothetical protein [Gottfriedia luciferensis]|uniref:hypothetical protein n=1 Tax=Gottfriedia luciferensis TaxID=178774 RepID=UPI001F1D6B03|nr:hypothetical protein [Gottfriedia luciferensis]
MRRLIKIILLGTAIATGLIFASGCSATITTDAPAKEKSGKSVVITKAEFDKIQNGMTSKQVFDIIGGKGEVMSEAGEKDKPGYTIMYMYKGKGAAGVAGANANFTFQDGKLMAKAQVGLK